MKPAQLLMAVALAGGLLAGALAPAHATTIPGGRYGNVVLTRPSGATRAFIVLFSGRAGWQAADQQAADVLARNGAMVVGVDTARYASTLAATKEVCHQLVGDAEGLSHQLQREQQSSRYFSPIVAGIGQGGSLAERMLEQAPANTLAGAAALDPEPQLDARFNPCPPDPTISRGNGFPGFLVIGAGTNVPAPTLPAGKAVGGKPPATVQRFDAGTPSADALLTLLEPYIRQHAPRPEDLVSDLPLVELPAARSSDMLAIVISGDGGWRDLDKSIAESLQKNGISVIGWDSLRYFWSPKTPQQTAQDLARVIQAYSTRWHTRHVALIGYSFGADVMPFVYTRLPEPLRAQVSLLALLGFAHSADFQIRVTGWLGLPASNDALPVAPEIAKVPPALIQCFYGEDENDTACPSLVATGATVIRTAGGHHFGRDYDSLEKNILDRWRKQIATR
jgi:type IV secretory pathway VirJ component